MLKGGDSGPAVVPSKPEESLLIQAVAHTHDELKMPPAGKLPDSSIAILRQWVSMGAPGPRTRPTQRLARASPSTAARSSRSLGVSTGKASGAAAGQRARTG